MNKHILEGNLSLVCWYEDRYCAINIDDQDLFEYLVDKYPELYYSIGIPSNKNKKARITIELLDDE